MHSIDDFKRRPSLEESLKPSENVKRKAGEVPFRCDTEFNGKSINIRIIALNFIIDEFNVSFFMPIIRARLTKRRSKQFQFDINSVSKLSKRNKISRLNHQSK